MANLKKLLVQDVEVGMYIEKMSGPWMASPFWQKQLLLDKAEDLRRLQASAIREVWINLDKSRVPPDAPVVSVSERESEPEPEPEPELEPQREQPVPASAPLKPAAPVSVASEMQRAAALLKKSQEAVQQMFGEARMGKAVTVDSAMPMVQEIAESVLCNSGALIGLARLKTADNYTYMHSVAVCALMIALGKELKLDDDQLRLAGMAGLLHDIGKMCIPLPILNKPGRLTEDEFASVRQHPLQGYQLLASTTDMPAAVLDVCLHHHEKMDGSGYPDRLQGDQISLLARMGAVCDVYDAITSNRPYKRGWCPAESLSRMAEWSRGHFDERVFAAFVRCLGIYPVGTLVRLKSERIGVVVRQSAAKSLIKPQVRVFYSARTHSYVRPELVDLALPAATDSIVAREDAATWGLNDVDRYWSGEITFA
ncbi:MAG: HD-GYP domain-containing protein [Burkholderiaceae bacterium]|nr:HD-GYP domain-containing protein [Burkholderiaceae bacterium]